MKTKVEDTKLVVCDVRDGSLISQRTPSIAGVQWIEVPGSRTEAGSYFQYVAVGCVPEPECLALPDHCSVDSRFVHVTKLNIQGEDLEVCHQDAEGHPIQATTY